jgi:hypothetical protein
VGGGGSLLGGSPQSLPCIACTKFWGRVWSPVVTPEVSLVVASTGFVLPHADLSRCLSAAEVRRRIARWRLL